MRRLLIVMFSAIGLLMFGSAGLMMQDQLMPRQKLEPFTADIVHVHKSERRMDLLAGGAVKASYRVALGGNPHGRKQQEGDRRTPEGRYVIDWRNPESRYFLSLHISYPDAEDKQNAAERGVSAGGDIMIHGQPNGFGVGGAILQNIDWTNGCIAVTNADMQEIWDHVPDGTPIEIRP